MAETPNPPDATGNGASSATGGGPVDPLASLIKQLHQAMPWQDAMSYAQIPVMLQQQKDLHRTGRRMEAQVDALLKTKYKHCGQEGAYEPPSDDEDMGDTYINCPVIGAETMASLAQSANQPAPSLPLEPTQPERPQLPDIEATIQAAVDSAVGSAVGRTAEAIGNKIESNKSWVQRHPWWLALLLLGSAGVGTSLGGLAASWFADDPSLYDAVAIPFEPAEPTPAPTEVTFVE